MMGAPSKTLQRILVVDDEPLVGNAVRMLLALDGYEVQAANGGEEALALLERSGFNLVITDYTMPGMRGDELALHIKARWPDKPVIMLTAYAENLRATGNIPPGVDALISKPFVLADFRFTVARALAGPPSPPRPEPE